MTKENGVLGFIVQWTFYRKYVKILCRSLEGALPFSVAAIVFILQAFGKRHHQLSGGLDLDPNLFLTPSVRPGLRGQSFRVLVGVSTENQSSQKELLIFGTGPPILL